MWNPDQLEHKDQEIGPERLAGETATSLKMKPFVRLSIIAIVLVARAAAQPQIGPNGVYNAASAAPVFLFNSSIAQGSIFSAYGTNLKQIAWK